MARSGGTVVGGPTLDTVLWVARQVVRQHTEPPDPTRATGRCSQCQDRDCAMFTWAVDTLDYYAPRAFEQVAPVPGARAQRAYAAAR